MRIVVKERAILDLRTASEWYNVRREGLGLEFIDEVNEKLEAISYQPLSCQLVEGSVRRAVLHQFPFSIYYLPEDDVLVVLAVLHFRRRPESWEDVG